MHAIASSTIARRQREAARLHALATAILAGAILSCSSTGPPPPTAVQGATDADELLIVDCLLPGEIRKLGRKLIFATPRRPVKTSARDCEIRGGEYVAFDRADYGTALKVWLPPAKEGDPRAQTYVGEIYEKGLGLAPDYATAATWYGRAAEQGYAPAQINLGQLYERGLGVPRDPVKALDWYRRASGLDGLGLPYLPAQPPAAAVGPAVLEEEELALRTELDRVRRALEDLRAERVATEEHIATARQELGRLKTEASVDAERLDQERARLALEAQRAAESRSEADRQRAELSDQEQDFARRQRDLEAREAEAELARREGRSEVGAMQREIDAARAALTSESQRLRDEAEALAQQRERSAPEQANAEQRARVLAERETELARQAQLIGMREAGVAARERAFASQAVEAERLDAEIARLQQQATTLDQVARSAAVAPAAPPVELPGPTIQLIEPPLPATRGLQLVATPSGAPERLIVGSVDAPAGLRVLTVNDGETPVDERGIFEVRVRVPETGARVAIIAVDRQGKRAERVLQLEPVERGVLAASATPESPPSRIDFGRYFALVVGNDEYARLTDLSTAVNDAGAVARLLREEYGFEVTLLTNATRYATLSALNELRAQLTEHDNLLIYYAGHGEMDEANARGHWLPTDAEAESTANWISNIAITDVLNAMSVSHALVVADSCYSGSLTRSTLARLEAGMTDEARDSWIRAMVAKRSRTALTSGGLEPVLDSGGGGHSIFARAFLDVLEANTGVLEGARLFSEVSARVTWAAEGSNFEQLPEYAPIRFAGHESGDFFFVRRSR